MKETGERKCIVVCVGVSGSNGGCWGVGVWVMERGEGVTQERKRDRVFECKEGRYSFSLEKKKKIKANKTILPNKNNSGFQVTRRDMRLKDAMKMC